MSRYRRSHVPGGTYFFTVATYQRQKILTHPQVLDENFVQAVVVTPLMRYRDDIQLRYSPDLQLIHVRSSSRLGISDMRVNRSRVEWLRSQIP